MQNAITFFGVIETLFIFLLFHKPVGSLNFTCEVHDKGFGNHQLKNTLLSYLFSENGISKSDSDTQFIKLSLRKSSNARLIEKLFRFQLEYSVMLHLFYCEDILRQVNLTQKKLRERGIGLDEANIFFNWNKDILVYESVNQSKTICEETEIPVAKRIRTKGKLLGEKKDDVCQALLQEVKRNLNEYHDRLGKELEAQYESMSHLQTVFAGLSLQAILEDS